MKRLIPVIVLAIVLASSSAWAADATAAVDINSAYVWRGITFNDGLVAQPSIDVSKNGFGINVWGNFDIDDYDNTLDANNFSEIDLTVYYGFTVSSLDVGVGLIEYTFPNGGSGTREVYVSLGVPIIGGLSASGTAYYDIDEVHGLYANLGLSYGMDLTDKLSLEAGGTIGIANSDYTEDYGGTEGGFYDYTLSLSASYAVTDALSVGAHITYVDSVNDDALPDGKYGTGVDVNTYGGVSVSYTF